MKLTGKHLLLGAAIIAAVAWAAETAIDPANRRINGSLTVVGNSTTAGTSGLRGVSTIVALDAGPDSKVSGVTIAAAASQDGGSVTPLIQFGYGAGTGGVLAVTFTKAFTSNPQCQCTHIGTTNLNGCVLTTASVPTTTTASFSVTSGGTDIIEWLCIGDK